MTPTTFKAQVGEWILGTLGEEESAEMQAFVVSEAFDDDCDRALVEALEAATLIGQALPPARLPEGGWERVEAAIGRRAVVPLAPRLRRTLPGSRALAAVAAVAAAVFVAFLWSNAQRAQLRDELSQQVERGNTLASQATIAGADKDGCLRLLSAAQKDLVAQREAMDILHHNATQLVRLSSKGKTAPEHVRAIFNPVAKRAWIVAPGLQAPAGKDYELWLVYGKDVLPAGLLRGDATNVLLATVDPNLLARGTPDSFLVTLEPKGGVDKSVGDLLLIGVPDKI